MPNLARSISTLADLADLRETEELEIKLALGRDGQGELPKDFWPTYSAFANTGGGYVILGLRESHGQFRIEQGIADPTKIRLELFDQLNNPQKASCNLLTQNDFEILEVDRKLLVSIHIPSASRRRRPVFVNGNPLKGTYRRSNEGDRLCDPETVKRMLAEQTEDSRDDRVLFGYGIEDLDRASIDIFRSMLHDSRVDHPFLDVTGLDFLQRIKAWRIDRETGRAGLTVAGVLMFGTPETIRDEFPNYALDYQEWDERGADRWMDRLTTDGTWSGNLLDFYRLTWKKLTSGLKIPFRLVDGRRRDETSAHVALREALVNALVHADYTGRSSVLITRRASMFSFRNPGCMRIPPEQAVHGGESDGRNRTLQQMFLLIGAGERAGSGVPKILKGWREQHWRSPTFSERLDPSEQTLLELHMEDLLPQDVSDDLRERFGSEFEGMSSEQRIVLCTAAVEKTVSHARAMTLCDMHPVDLTRMLQSLVQRGCLARVGQGRGSRYHLPDTLQAGPRGDFEPELASRTSDLADQPSDLVTQPSDLAGQPSDLATQPSDLAGRGLEVTSTPFLGRRVAGLDLPLVDVLESLDPGARALLVEITARAKGGRVPRDRMIGVIATLCEGRYVTVRVLAQLLGRSEDYIRQGYVNPLVRSGDLLQAFPEAPNDPRQAYTVFEAPGVE